MGQKRNRRTQAEMLEHHKAKIAEIEARMAGKMDTSSPNGVLKSLKARRRRISKELKSANITLNGIPGAEGKGWARSPIDAKIESTKARLQSQLNTKDRATVFASKLPFDVERLDALIEAAEQGAEIEFPKDLTPLSDSENRTDEEHEAIFAAGDEEDN